ncbi:hypothetical protein Csa_010901 [Cucumis sativus]|uniref:Uncharacterized protein n=1 Tax=Cucumis sativus TaxID=3659 RepID=A0A0A0L5N7_CUCSA|nr:hypothetical protein Csa_010901 [Cucumis sativus]
MNLTPNVLHSDVWSKLLPTPARQCSSPDMHSKESSCVERPFCNVLGPYSDVVMHRKMYFFL